MSDPEEGTSNPEEDLEGKVRNDDMLKEGDIVMLERQHLYWVQLGSRTLNAVITDQADAKAKDVIRGRILGFMNAPTWGKIVFLAVEGNKPPTDSSFVVLHRHCERCT